MFGGQERRPMLRELASAFAGFVLIQGAIFIVGDGLGLLGERFGKIKLIVNWMADLPGALVSYFFSHTPNRHYKVHLTPKH
jgi:hypothetical protein